LRRLYLDTSLLVAALVHETGTDTAVRFLQDHAQQLWMISPWMTTELASALALQVRRGAIAPEESQEAWQRRTLKPPPVSAWHRCRPCGQGMPCTWPSANG
jgi:predicted nucleic acid-binding protein